MKMKKTTAFLLVLVFCISQCMTVFASDAERDIKERLNGDVKTDMAVVAEQSKDETMEFDSAGNMFWSGEDLALTLEKFFTAFTMGKRVNINEAEAEGSVFSMAQDVVIADSKIKESAFLAGETVTVKDSPVDGNIFAMGRKVDVSGKSNAVFLMAQDVIFDGETKALSASGEKVSVSGRIDGDAKINASSAVISPDLEVTGNLQITAKEEPEIPKTAKIGTYEFIKVVEDDGEGAKKAAKMAEFFTAKKIISVIYWIIALSLLAMLLSALFGFHIDRSGEVFRKKPGLAVAKGLLGMFATPFIILFMCCTIILAPAGGLLLLAYILLLFAGISFTGASLGRLIFPKMHAFLSAVICTALLELLAQIPFAGGVIVFLTQMYLISYATSCVGEALSRNKTKAEAAKISETQVLPAAQIETAPAPAEETVSEAPSHPAAQDPGETSEENR